MGWRGEVALFVAVALVLRAPLLLFSELGWDEGLYRLMAERLGAGVAPYVEVWDRKPVGLFVLLAGIEALVGGSVAALRCAVAVLVGVSAALVAGIARALVPEGDRVLAGRLAGLVYVLASLRNGGVEVNAELLLAPLALGGVRLALAAAPSVRIALAAGLLIGMAVQVKQVAAFDALFVMILLAGRLPVERAMVLAGAGAVGLALPLGAVLLWYGAIGRLGLFVEANLWAVLRGGYSNPSRMLAVLVEYAPLVAACVALPLVPGLRRLGWVVWLWLGCVGLGITAVGRLIDHEAIHALPALSIGVGAVLAAGLRAVPGRRVVLGLMVVGLAVWGGASTWPAAGLALRWRYDAGVAHWGDRTATVAARLDGRVGAPGDILVVSRMVGLYRATGVAPPTRFAFMPHLWAGYAPVDGAAEMARILAGRPRFVVVDDAWLPRPGQFAPALAVLHVGLRRDYVSEVRVGVFDGRRLLGGTAGAVVFRRRDVPEAGL